MWNPFKKKHLPEQEDMLEEEELQEKLQDEGEEGTMESSEDHQSYPSLPDFNRENTKRIRTVTTSVLIDSVKRTSSLKKHAAAVSREARALSHTIGQYDLGGE